MNARKSVKERMRVGNVGRHAAPCQQSLALLDWVGKAVLPLQLADLALPLPLAGGLLEADRVGLRLAASLFAVVFIHVGVRARQKPRRL